ncbi:acyltransferase [Saccharophagus degradans]|uniref:acyltransferase family protein n=1 Tax=Saccharophagus degradans TaxID=86304 RepID=UPI002477F640|nr:acyltransferase [Saccharophagus degradans]WGO98408.1 acyltransferase [Saccharophagus degradans]
MTSSNALQKFHVIDYLRAICMIYIVCYWHLIEYLDVSFLQPNKITESLAYLVLGLFFMISGFLNGSDKNKEFVSFYQRKILRIYPLYFCALVIFHLLGLNDGVTSLKAALFVSPFLDSSPVTLWFVAELFVFLLITPFLLRIKSSLLLIGILLSGFYFATLAMDFSNSMIDSRVVKYFPAYFLGVLAAGGKPINSKVVLVVLMSIMAALLAHFVTRTNDFLLLEVVCVQVGSFSILFYSLYKLNIVNESQLVAKVSFLSFVTYLIHRPIYEVLDRCLNVYDVGIVWPFFVGVAIPMLAFIAYFIQQYYDKLSKMIFESDRQK